MLPLLGSLSDQVGRRPLLLALPCAALALRLVAVAVPAAPLLVASKVLMGAIVSSYFLLVGTSCADLFEDDGTALAALEGRSAAAWGAAYAVGMVAGGGILARGAQALASSAASVSTAALRAAYGASAALAAFSLGIALVGTRESAEPAARRVSKRQLARDSSPGGARARSSGKQPLFPRALSDPLP